MNGRAETGGGPDAGVDLSVVLVTRDSFASIRRPVAHLRRQTARARVELVVVAPGVEALREEGVDLDGFASLRVVAVKAIRSRGQAAAAGIEAASAPVVVLLENHSYPDEGWAAALIEAHRGPWTCVGPMVRNANPESATSRANFLISYGSWSPPAEAGEVDLLPFHNSAYKRAALEPFGGRLAALLDREGELQAELRGSGGRLYLEPAATTAHVNEAAPWTSLYLLFCLGRSFGATRCRSWSGLRRAAYAAAAPAIPLVNLPRLLGYALSSTEPRRLAIDLPALFLHACAHAAGEVLGYAAGEGGAHDFVNEHEFLAEGRDPTRIRTRGARSAGPPGRAA